MSNFQDNYRAELRLEIKLWLMLKGYILLSNWNFVTRFMCAQMSQCCSMRNDHMATLYACKVLSIAFFSYRVLERTCSFIVIALKIIWYSK